MKSELFNTILSIELEENLYFYLKDFLDSHPDWNQDKFIIASLDSFFAYNQAVINPEVSQTLAQEIQAKFALN